MLSKGLRLFQHCIGSSAFDVPLALKNPPMNFAMRRASASTEVGDDDVR